MENNNKSSEIKTKNKSQLLPTIFGGFVLVMGLKVLFSSFIGGLLVILAGSLVLPVTSELIKKKIDLSKTRGLKTFLVFFLIVISTMVSGDSVSKVPTTNTQREAQVSIPVVNTTPTKPKTLEEKIKDAIENKMGSNTNMGKTRVVSIEVTKYKPTELSTYSYKSTDEIKGVFIKINASENLTSNLQKSTLNKEASQLAQEVFKVSSEIGDIILWSQLPLADKYGNKKDGTAVAYSIARPLYEKINWTDFYYNKLPEVLKSEHSADDRNNYYEAIRF